MDREAPLQAGNAMAAAWTAGSSRGRSGEEGEGAVPVRETRWAVGGGGGHGVGWGGVNRGWEDEGEDWAAVRCGAVRGLLFSLEAGWPLDISAAVKL